jgi:hypothetical protein
MQISLYIIFSTDQIRVILTAIFHSNILVVARISTAQKKQKDISC